MEIDEEKGVRSDSAEKAGRGVRETLLMGVFWRILIIEGILLVGTLIYEALTANAEASHLFWYALRIISLVGIIILFMMFDNIHKAHQAFNKFVLMGSLLLDTFHISLTA